MPEDLISVEVACALPHEQCVVQLSLANGADVQEAIRRSGVLLRFPDLERAPVGIYGRIVARDTRLRDGDRVEIYRALVADPKQMRRRRAAGAE